MATTCTVSDPGDIATGDAVCVIGFDSGTYPTRPVLVARATAANLATSKTVFGVCKLGAADGSAVNILVAGEVAEEAVTSLGGGDSRIIATDIYQAAAADQCRLIRVDRPDGSEHFIGTCDENGHVAVEPRASNDTSPQHVFNVRAYGAVWDGVTDDTAAIRAALRAAATIYVFVPAPGVTVAVGATTVYTRLDGGDFAGGDGIQEGMILTISGFGDACDGVKTVVSVTSGDLEVAEAGAGHAVGVADIFFKKTTGGIVWLPSGTGRTTATLDIPHSTLLRGAGHRESIIFADHDGIALAQYGTVNVGGEGRSHFSDFGVRGNYGDGEMTPRTTMGIYTQCSFSEFSRLRVQGCIDGIVLDQSENVTIENYEGEGNTRASIWLVNGEDVVEGTSGGFTNVITIRDCSFLGGQYGIADDGGNQHYISASTFEANSVASLRLAGLAQSKISTCYIESAGLLFVNTTLVDETAVGGPVQLEIEKCVTTSQHTITAGSGPDVYFKHCQFRSAFDEIGTPSTAFVGGGYAAKLVFQDCIDLQGYGLLDANPTIGRIGAAGGDSEKSLVTSAYQSPLAQTGDPLFGTRGDICWNSLPSNVRVESGPIEVTVAQDDADNWTYTRSAGNFSGDGFKPGMRVTFAGFATGAPQDGANNGDRTVIGITNGGMTLTVATYSPAGADEGPTADTTVTFEPTPFMGWVCLDTSTIWSPFAPIAHALLHVRGVVTVEEDVGAFDSVTGGTIRDGVTYVAGDRVLLANQADSTENGVYVVGTVAGGSAPLERAVDMPMGGRVPAGAVFELSEGDVMGLTTWKVTTAGQITVGTTAFAVYPRMVRGSSTLAAGTFTLSCPVLDASKTVVTLARTNAPQGPPVATDTVMYAPTNGGANGLTAGTEGSVIVEACLADGTINADDTSTLAWSVTNW